MGEVRLHTLLMDLMNELKKGRHADKGKLGILVDKSLVKASRITNNTKNKELKASYHKHLIRLNRKSDPRFRDINNWARVVLNVLIVTFSHRL